MLHSDENLSSFKLMSAQIELAQTIKYLHNMGLAPATAGNFSLTLSHDPIRLLMSPTGADKGSLAPEDLIEIGSNGEKLAGNGNPSAETLLHLTVVEERGAGSVLHTHSRWNTILSRRYLAERGLVISGLEVLKALSGVKTHQHEEFVPILDNSQEMKPLSDELREVLQSNPNCHAFLLAGHGMYTWGKDLSEARRHVEAFEFLFDILGSELWLS